MHETYQLHVCLVESEIRELLPKSVVTPLFFWENNYIGLSSDLIFFFHIAHVDKEIEAYPCSSVCPFFEL